jgi:subtilase family serine protease
MGNRNVNNVQPGSATDGSLPPSSRPTAFRRWGLSAVALGVILGTAQLAAAVPSQAATGSTARVALGQAPSLPKGALAAAAPSADTKLSLDIQLNTGHAAQLEAYATAVGNRNSPYYHQYLTPSEIASAFGATTAQADTVESQLRSEGLTVGSLSSDGMFLSASGTVAQAEHAFGVTIAGYRDAGRDFYANTKAPTLPASIAGNIQTIVGLDDVDYVEPLAVSTGQRATLVTPSTTNSNATSNYSAESCSSIVSAWNAYNTRYDTHLQNGSGYYLANTVDSIYGISPLLSAGDDGAGVTVAVVEFENYNATGVKDINSCYGHSTSVSEDKVDGGPTAPANMYKGVGAEAALDIENIADTAPGVSVVDYAGPDWAAASDSNVVDTYAAAVNQDKANVISTSWAECEASDAEYYPSMTTQENTLFEQAAAQGQTVVAASGDEGSTSCYGYGIDDSDLQVQNPSSQPFVLGVGGTQMTGTSNPAQTVWNDSWPGASAGTTNYGSGGGGVSTQWPEPSYQSGATGSGYANNCADATTTGCRQVPDVSALADPLNGYVIQAYYNDGVAADTSYPYWIYGGTSGAAPTWAAIIALADASTTCRLNGEAGFVNPDLYTAGESASSASSVFTDITSGSNWIPAYGSPDEYPATSGYDLASGWGAPKAAGVVAHVCQAGAVSPASYFVPDGPARILDTRSGIGGATGPVGANKSVQVHVDGVNGVPSSGVSAVVLNVTVVSPSSNGVATVYPDGGSVPTASNLNWRTGATDPNLVVVPVGSDGEVDIWNGATGTAQFIADEEGYFTSSATATGVSTYTPIGPVRAMDTRSGIGVSKAKIAAGQDVSLQVGGASITSGGQTYTIPAGITGVAMNVTAVDATANSVLTVYPNETSTGSPVTTPSTSNLNFHAGQTAANLVIVPVGEDGVVDFANGAKSGATDAIADIAGYFTAGTSGEKYHALGPVRLLDTRVGEGETSVAPLAGKGTLPLGLPASYGAIVANLTVVSPKSNGFVSAYPESGTVPNVSNINFLTGQTIPNLAIVPSRGGVEFFNDGTGSTQLILDLAGYFSAS